MKANLERFLSPKKNPKFWIALGVVILLFSISIYNFQNIDEYFESREIARARETIRLTSDELEELKTGDIIFRKGYGFISDWVSKNLEHGPYDLTHVGIVVKKPEGLFVAHALSSKKNHVDGVILEPLNRFLKSSKPANLLIVRWMDYKPEMDAVILDAIEKYIKDKVPFDHKGDYSSSDALYCNEMVVKLWMNNLGLINPPNNDETQKELFHNLSVLYNPNHSKIIFNSFK